MHRYPVVACIRPITLFSPDVQTRVRARLHRPCTDRFYDLSAHSLRVGQTRSPVRTEGHYARCVERAYAVRHHPGEVAILLFQCTRLRMEARVNSPHEVGGVEVHGCQSWRSLAALAVYRGPFRTELRYSGLPEPFDNSTILPRF
jgi:hypothetical protein